MTILSASILLIWRQHGVCDRPALEEMALAMEGRFVKVDDRYATSTINVWAIGDLVGEPMLTHKASAQCEMGAEAIAGKRRSDRDRAD